MTTTALTPADTLRAAAAALTTIADGMADDAAAIRTDGQIAADHGHGATRPDWTAAHHAAVTVLEATR